MSEHSWRWWVVWEESEVWGERACGEWGRWGCCVPGDGAGAQAHCGLGEPAGSWPRAAWVERCEVSEHAGR